MAMRAVVVDDEPLARERIRSLLAGDQAFELVAECGDGAAALEAITIHSPDLLFLDVQMPEMDGFAVLQSLPTDSLPAIVFVTAYDEYAFKAFEVNAVDYLLKPLEPERFQAALQRVRERLDRRGTAEAEPELRALLAQLRAERPAPVRIVVREGERLFFVRAEEVDWIDAAGNYARLHARGKTHLVRETMKSLGPPRPHHIRPHPPFGDRERGPDRIARAVLPRRVRRDHEGRHPLHLQSIS